jgi:hypothetical protein
MVLAISGNGIGLAGGVIVSFVQWLVLTATLWILFIMFKNKKTSELDFDQIGSATGKLWAITIAINFVLLLGSILLSMELLTGLVGMILFIILIVMGIALLYSHYKLVKIMFSSNKGRHIIVWIFSIIISGIVSGTLLSLLNLVL